MASFSSAAASPPKPWKGWPECLHPEVEKSFEHFAQTANTYLHVVPRHRMRPGTGGSTDIAFRPPPGVYVKFLGTAGLVITDSEHTILIDPYFSRMGFDMYAMNEESRMQSRSADTAEVCRWLSLANIPHVDAIICTHGHFDHALDIAAARNFFKERDGRTPPVYAGPSVINIVLGALMSESEHKRYRWIHELEGKSLDESRHMIIDNELFSPFDLAFLRRFHLKPIQCPFNTDDFYREVTDNAGAYAHKVLEPVLEIGSFTIKFIRGRHLKIPRTNALQGAVRSPLYQPAPITSFNEGELINMCIEHPLGGSTLILGSANFIPDQIRKLHMAWKIPPIDCLIAGVAGLSLSGGVLTGDQGIWDDYYFEDFYRETVQASGAKQILLSHWDDFSKPLDEEAGVQWMDSLFWPVRKTPKNVMDWFLEAFQSEKCPFPRSFEFLPLFTYVSIPKNEAK